ncbi:MAG: nitrogen assimilation response regulator NtrX [Parvularculaceae bacterium]
MARDILIVDDEADIRELVAGILEDEGYEARSAADGDSAMRCVSDRMPSLVILDIWLQGSQMDGLQVLDELKALNPDLPVVIISGHGNIETAVSAIKRGAYDFVEKPFNADRILIAIQRALEAARLKRENSELRARVECDDLTGCSAAIAQVRQVIDRVAQARSRVFVSGPAGAGKEVVARLIHQRSARRNNPFIAVNAAAIAADRMEIELFGVEGGRDRRVGVFEQAHGGTLLLDEIADMPLETQGKILRVLIDQTFQRVGGSRKVQVDVRVISTTSRCIQEACREGRFREDLYHRLNVVPIRVPPLTERREDIPALARQFVDQIANSTGLPNKTLTDDVVAALQAYDWPGNVRQLRNVIERTLILAADDSGGQLTTAMLPQEILDGGLRIPRGEEAEHIIALPLRDARERFEREYLLAQINRFGGNISRTAAFIGMERSALHRKLKSLGVSAGARQERFDA